MSDYYVYEVPVQKLTLNQDDKITSKERFIAIINEIKKLSSDDSEAKSDK